MQPKLPICCLEADLGLCCNLQSYLFLDKQRSRRNCTVLFYNKTSYAFVNEKVGSGIAEMA